MTDRQLREALARCRELERAIDEALTAAEQGLTDDELEVGLRYALTVSCREARSADGTIVTRDGERRWVTRSEWVEATSCATVNDSVPSDVMTWDDEEGAATFAKRWQGHPWYCQPNGGFDVVPVARKFSPTGWMVAHD
jgi:hypothetical protein